MSVPPRKTGPVGVVKTGEVSPLESPLGPDPTNADLARELVSLRRDFADHAERDRVELHEVRTTLGKQPTTTVLAVIVSLATLATALVHAFVGG